MRAGLVPAVRRDSVSPARTGGRASRPRAPTTQGNAVSLPRADVTRRVQETVRSPPRPMACNGIFRPFWDGRFAKVEARSRTRPRWAGVRDKGLPSPRIASVATGGTCRARSGEEIDDDILATALKARPTRDAEAQPPGQRGHCRAQGDPAREPELNRRDGFMVATYVPDPPSGGG